jgi:hypothetical protein
LTAFKIKIYRCEWQIVAEEVDQYDELIFGKAATVFASYPTFAEAKSHIGDYLAENQHTGRLLPKDATHTYWSGGVRYKEVEICPEQ